MRRTDTDIRNPDKLLMRSHPEITEIWCETKKDEFNRYAVLVTVGDGSFRVSIGLPNATLKIDSKRVWREVTEDFICRKFASNKNHDSDQREKSIEPRAAVATLPFSGSAACLGAAFLERGR